MRLVVMAKNDQIIKCHTNDKLFFMETMALDAEFQITHKKDVMQCNFFCNKYAM